MPDGPVRAIMKVPGAARLAGGPTIEPIPRIARHDAIGCDGLSAHDWPVSLVE